MAVGVLGFIPDYFSISKAKSPSTNPSGHFFDTLIVDSGFLTDYYDNYREICTISGKIPNITVYRSNNNTNRGVFLHIPFHYRFALISRIKEPLCESYANCAYVITNEKFLFEGFHIDNESKVFREINKRMVSHVLSMKNRGSADKLCRKSILTPLYSICVYITLISMFFFFANIYIRNVVFNTPEGTNIWIFNSEKELIFGSSMHSTEKMVRDLVYKLLERSITIKRRTICVLRLIRKESSIDFQRVACYPVSNHVYIAMTWIEKLPEKCDIKFDCQIVSNSVHVKSKPIVTYSSFRDIRPFHVEFEMDSGNKCSIHIPSQVLAPFQPYSHINTSTSSILEELFVVLDNSACLFSDFLKICQLVCKKLGLRYALFFGSDNRLMFNYQREDLPPLINVDKIPQIVKIESGFCYIKGLIEQNSRAFVYKIVGNSFSLLTILQTEENDQTYVNLGFSLPFFSVCMSFLYQITSFKEDQLVYDRFSRLIGNAKDIFTLVVYNINDDSFSYMHTPIFETTPLDLNELLAQFSEIVKVGNENLCKSINSIVLNEMTSSTHLIEVMMNGKVCYISLSLSRTINENNHNCLIIIGQDMTDLKAQEKELITSLYDLTHIVHDLNGQSFVSHMADGAAQKVFIELGHNSKIQIEEIVHAEDVKNLEKAQNGIASPFRLIDSKGKSVWYYGNNNSKFGYMFCIQDIVDIKTRLSSSDIMNNLSRFSYLVYWIVDPISDQVIPIMNRPTIWDLLNVDSQQKFSTFINYIHQDDKQAFSEKYQLFVNGGISEFETEARTLRYGNQYDWCKLVFSRSQKGIYNCYGFGIDHHKELETALRDTKSLRDLLMLSGKLLLWKFDENKDIETGVINSNMLVMNWEFIKNNIPVDYQEIFSNKIMKAMINNESIEMDLPLLLEKEQWVSLRGKVATRKQIFGVCIDITDIRNAYHALETEKRIAVTANKQKTLFLSSLSHEIRTPLNGIVGILDVLAMQELSNEQRFLVDSMRSSSFQLMRLLDDTLNLSKIEQGEIDFKPAVVNILKILEPICIATLTKARLNRIKFIVTIEKDFPSLVICDPQYILQIVNNLLSNALKFTKVGSITLSLFWEYDNEHESLVIQVTDTGIGITSEQQRMIFDRFAQADDSVIRFYGGTGLGLALVQEIVRYLRGSVSLDSTPQEGSSFLVKIPLKSVMIPYSPVFSDRKSHAIVIHVKDQDLYTSLTEWLSYHKFVVFSLVDIVNSVSFSSIGKIHCVLIEGLLLKSAEFQAFIKNNEINRPIICSICEPGETSKSSISIVKPVMPHQIISLLGIIRYQKHEIVHSVPSYNIDDHIKRILIVEDNLANQFVMKKIMSSLGYSYKIADNGEIALGILEKEEFDMIFMDCQMPILDGIETTKRIRKSGQPYSSIPIIALTASAVEGDEKVCREAGMDGYLSKPVRIQQITDIMKSIHTPG